MGRSASNIATNCVRCLSYNVRKHMDVKRKEAVATGGSQFPPVLAEKLEPQSYPVDNPKRSNKISPVFFNLTESLGLKRGFTFFLIYYPP